jgi:hypothetical protein
MTLTPKNRSSSSTPSQIIQSSDTEFQISPEIIAVAELQDIAGIRVEARADVKLIALRRMAEYVVAVVSLLFLGTAVQTFLPSTAKLVESSFAAAGMSFLIMLKDL